MKQKLFENVGQNQFKLITESVVEDNPKAALVREGLKKVFSSGMKELSYKRLQGVGMGYIKSVEEAKKTAIQEARELAAEYGYVENESAQTFVKEAATGEGNRESSHDETNASNESMVVDSILSLCHDYLNSVGRDTKSGEYAGGMYTVKNIEKLAQQLVQSHGPK